MGKIIDLREAPTYTPAEAAHYLLVPVATVRWWTTGAPHGAKPVIITPPADRRMLSFFNMAEIHILDSLRRKHNLPLQQLRQAINYLERHFTSQHPLIEHNFQTDGVDLFIDHVGTLLNVTKEGQFAMKGILQTFLNRIEYDEKGLASKLYPFTTAQKTDESRIIVLDPYISFGRPVIAGTGITTAVVAERYKAGESIADLAKDYGRTSVEIEDAIRCELQTKAA